MKTPNTTNQNAAGATQPADQIKSLCDAVEAARAAGGYTVWMQTPEGERQLGSPSGYVHNKYVHACIWAGWSQTTTKNPVIVRDMCGTIAFRATAGGNGGAL